MIKEFDCVKLRSPSDPRLKDQTGTVVDVLSQKPPFYIVEFVNKDGSTQALLDLGAEDLILVSAHPPESDTRSSQQSSAAVRWKKLKQIFVKS